jgi:hypothetical protein
VGGLVVILESTSQDVFDIEDLYFDSDETLMITAAKYQDEADSLLANKDKILIIGEMLRFRRSATSSTTTTVRWEKYSVPSHQ